ncbi:hypothetical protein [Nostoc sp. T09]|nr:hypothetical protein [Nostoc sp. T09]
MQSQRYVLLFQQFAGERSLNSLTNKYHSRWDSKRAIALLP